MSDGQRWRDEWAVSTTYEEGDLVKYGGTVYICIDGHTSAATAASGLEANSGDWNQFVEGTDWKNDWAISTRYKLNDIVRYGGINYICITGHTSAATAALGLENGSANWQVYSQGQEYLGTWVTATRYKLNDVVKYGAGLWICTTQHTAAAEFATDSANWAQYVEGFEYESTWSSATAYQPGDVVKYGGNAMTEERLKHGFARDVILLKLVGMNPVVVHGGGPQIDNALKKIGKQGSFVQGMRITDEETMEVVEWVLGGEVQQDIVMLINHYGGQAVGLTGKDGGLIRARKMQMPDKDNPGKFLDIGFVGEIDGINPAVVKALQDDAFIPIISPIGFGEDGQAYNINADLVAGKIAEILRAEKLIMMTNIPGVLDKNGNLLTDLSAREIDEMFADGTISGGMLPKISSVLDAAKSGVNTVHIIDGRIEHSLLLEVLTEQAFGTMIRSH